MFGFKWNYSSLPWDSENDAPSQTDHKAKLPSKNRQSSHRSANTKPNNYLAISIVLNTAFAISLIFLLVNSRAPEPSGFEVIGDFIPNDNFQSIRHETDHFWDDFSADSSGFLELPHKEYKYGGIAMFHQLHCLAMLRGALQDVHDGKEIEWDSSSTEHWPHCFDYLRQSILCFADQTLELPSAVTHLDTGATYYLFGGRQARYCRNSEKLFTLRAEKGVDW